jgi:hypothetical protein
MNPNDNARHTTNDTTSRLARAAGGRAWDGTRMDRSRPVPAAAADETHNRSTAKVLRVATTQARAIRRGSQKSRGSAG